MGSLLTPIFRNLGIPLDQAMVVRDRVYTDVGHLTGTVWLKEGCFLIQLPHRTAKDFQGEVSRLEFHPDPLLLHNPIHMPHRAAVPRAARAARDPPEASFPDFPTSRTYRCATMVISSAL